MSESNPAIPFTAPFSVSFHVENQDELLESIKDRIAEKIAAKIVDEVKGKVLEDIADVAEIKFNEVLASFLSQAVDDKAWQEPITLI